jgi:hypothetical protein
MGERPRSRSLTNYSQDDRVDAPDEETRSNEGRLAYAHAQLMANDTIRDEKPNFLRYSAAARFWTARHDSLG